MNSTIQLSQEQLPRFRHFHGLRGDLIDFAITKSRIILLIQKKIEDMKGTDEPSVIKADIPSADVTPHVLKQEKVEL